MRTLIERLHIERPDDTVVIIADKASNAGVRREGHGRGPVGRHHGCVDRGQSERQRRLIGKRRTATMNALRVPIAVIVSGVLTTSMFWLLWHLVGAQFDTGQLPGSATHRVLAHAP